MKSVKTLRPGQKGTKKWVTVDEGVKKQERKQIPGNKLVLIHVKQNERYLQKMIKAAGARWKPERGLWQMPFGEVIALGLEKRMVSNKSVFTR